MPDVFVMYEKSRGMSGEAVFAFSISNTMHVCRHPHGLHDVGPHGLHDVGLCIVAQKCPAIRCVHKDVFFRLFEYSALVSHSA